MSFLEEFKASFEALEAGESPAGNASVDVVDNDEVTKAQEETLALLDSALSSDMAEDAKQIHEVSTALGSLGDNIKALGETSPALVESAVLTVNEQVKDTARLLQLDAPEDIAVDPETGEIEEVSMEGVLDWLGNVIKAFVRSLGNIKHRMAIWLNRISKTTSTLRTRVARCYKLMPRRKNVDGGTYVKLNDKMAIHLVQGNGIAEDLAGELSKLIDAVNIVFAQYAPVADKISANLALILSQVSGKFITGSNDAKGQAFDIEIKDELNIVDALVSQNVLYLGNEQLKIKNGRSIIPNIQLVKSRPDPKYILSSLGGIPSRSNDEIRELLAAVQAMVFESIKVLEDTADRIYRAYDGMVGTISRIQDQNTEPMGTLSDNKYIAGAQIGYKMTQVWNYANLSKLESRIHNELGDLVDGTLVELVDAVLFKTHCVVAYVEETLTKD